ncbi:MAG TPA: Hsp20/alpha crystallin family protein [Parafilimonas sp.]|jgi:HSP20 family protein|nr:Hsp20/alpha crystallin family protein [Parafilimonas sp.]
MTTIMKRDNGSSNMPSTFTGLVDQLFQDNLTRFFNDDFWGSGSVSRSSQVPVNIKETDKTYEMELVAPGLKKEDLKLNVSNDMLTVSFEHKEENNQENENEGWLKREYRHQSFSRSFSLDDTIDANKISAKYQDGVLHLSLPKKEGAQKISKNIEIK